LRVDGKAGAAIEEAPWYFAGLDLGQSQDHSALAVVERVELIWEDRDAATFERRRERRCRVRYLERVALGTSYPRWWSGCGRWCSAGRWRADARW
jgi:hypothetical protein